MRMRHRPLHSASRITRWAVRMGVPSVLLLLDACVRWQSIPVAELSARPLPRWVQVTTRDSTRYTLEGARLLPGDTLVGSPAGDDPQRRVRLPLAEIANVDARVPSGSGSIGVGALIIGGVLGLIALIGHA